MTIILLLSYVLMGLNCFAFELAPEDGSVNYEYFVYRPGRNKIKNLQIENAFEAEGVTPKQSKIYDWLQDILFVTSKGEIILMPDFPPQAQFFDDLTLGVFEDEGHGGKLLKLHGSMIDFDLEYAPQFQQARTLYLEGGGAISGKFSNGENYLIILEKRFLKSLNAFNSKNNSNLTVEKFKHVIFDEYQVKADNLILLNDFAGTQHLDLYMKALPNGEILLDDPTVKLELVRGLIENDKLDSFEVSELKDILAYETTEALAHRRSAYERQITYVRNALSSKFNVVMVPGRFFQQKEYAYERTGIEETINFFNGVNGVNKQNGHRYYITNKAKGLKVLEAHWGTILQPFNYKPAHIHFVGTYSNGAGLDCIGVMVPAVTE